jgi:hypothetical protein
MGVHPPTITKYNKIQPLFQQWQQKLKLEGTTENENKTNA